MRTDKRREQAVRSRFRGIKITPALVISTIALFAALAGTGWAQEAVPLAKRALSADKAKVATNAQRLNGRTATQIAATAGPATDAATLNGQTAAQIAATPGPTSSLSGSLFTYRTQSWSVDSEEQVTRDTANCLAGERAIAGGWEQSSGVAYVLADKPTPDGSGWQFIIFGESGNDLPAVGTIYAVCARVS
jgi:hypothetical protein